MRIRLTFQSIVSRSPMIIIGLSFITIVWVSLFLYTKLYKPITQAETIILLRSESALQSLDFQAYEKLKQYQAARYNLKSIDVPTRLNPFRPSNEVQTVIQ